MRENWSNVALIACLALSACSDSMTGPESVAGTYTLISVADQNLPATVFIGAGATFTALIEAGETITVTSGAQRLNSDSTCSLQINWSVWDGVTTRRSTLTDTCTFRLVGRAVIFSRSDERLDFGAFNRSTLSVRSLGIIFVFEK